MTHNPETKYETESWVDPWRDMFCAKVRVPGSPKKGVIVETPMDRVEGALEPVLEGAEYPRLRGPEAGLSAWLEHLVGQLQPVPAGMSGLVGVLEFRTVGLDLPRRVGKTSALVRFAHRKRDCLVVAPNEALLRPYKDSWCALCTPGTVGFARGRQFKYLVMDEIREPEKLLADLYPCLVKELPVVVWARTPRAYTCPLCRDFRHADLPKESG